MHTTLMCVHDFVCACVCTCMHAHVCMYVCMYELRTLVFTSTIVFPYTIWHVSRNCKLFVNIKYGLSQVRVRVAAIPSASQVIPISESREALRRKEGDGNGSTRKRGRPKRRWLDKVKDDIKEKGLSADEVYDRMSSYIDPT